MIKSVMKNGELKGTIRAILFAALVTAIGSALLWGIRVEKFVDSGPRFTERNAQVLQSNMERTMARSRPHELALHPSQDYRDLVGSQHEVMLQQLEHIAKQLDSIDRKIE